MSRLLVLAPHTDDAEFGCGGLIATRRAQGWRVLIVSLACPPPAQLLDEATAAAGVLGAELNVLQFPTRNFAAHRQEILELLVTLRDSYEPTVVCAPSRCDVHQDHGVVAAEALRAFKHTTLLGYELPWNAFAFHRTAYVPLTGEAVQRKLDAIACYESQSHRLYANPEYVRAVLLARGVEIGVSAAEAFEVERMVL